MINVPFDYALDYHSYGEYLMFPWGYPAAGQSHTPEHDFFLELANGMNGTLGNRFDVGTIPEVLYQVNGGSVDYHYGEQTEKNKIYGFTFEVNTSSQGGFGPNESYIEPTVTEQEGPFFWLLAYMHGVSGVELEAFDAQKRAGAALVSWAARCEYNHAGYNLYRAEAGVDGARVKVNGALITGVSPYRFVDEGVEAGKRYAYYLEAVDLSGRTTGYGPARLDMGAAKPAAFALGQNQPNPARGVTRIPVSLAAAGPATLAVYDVAGRCVANVDLGKRPAGAGMVDLDVAAFTPGVYVYRLVAGGDAAARRMVVTR